MKIGTTIRGFRLQKGLSQGDVEKRTGLLRCYLSRVENGHTVPSLDTLAKIAQALDLPLAQFFAEDSLGREINTQKLTDDEIKTNVKITEGSRWWAEHTRFSFDGMTFVARLKWGKTISIDVNTGKIAR